MIKMKPEDKKDLQVLGSVFITLAIITLGLYIITPPYNPTSYQMPTFTTNSTSYPYIIGSGVGYTPIYTTCYYDPHNWTGWCFEK